MSSRRLSKGSGRRPMMDKRRRFLELLAQGWSLRGACRELGIHRSTGQMWKNGAAVRLTGGTVEVVPPLEPLTVRVTSRRFLSEDEREQIADLASRGRGPTVIGQLLGRAPSTISRDLRRNLLPGGDYRPFHVHAAAAAR
jgi:IS30 family transposase